MMHAIQMAIGRVRRLTPMVILYWLFHTLLAAAVALPLASVAVDQLAHSKYGPELLKQFDLMWLGELCTVTQMLPALSTGFTAAVALVLLYLGGVFLAGGAVWHMVHDAVPYRPASFYENCGKHFWRFFRLSLYSLIFYGLAFTLSRIPTRVADKIWGEGMEAWPLVMAGWISQALLILLIGFVSTAMDYAKVRLVADDSRKSFKTAFASVAFVFKHLWTTMGVWVVLAILWLLATIGYVAAANHIESRSMGPIVGLLVLQQFYVFMRICLRMTSWGAAGQIDFALRRKPAILPEEPVPVMAVVRDKPPVLEAEAAEEPPQEGWNI